MQKSDSSIIQLATGVKESKPVKALVVQSCPTLCDAMDSSPPGSSVHAILQAKILEWVAVPFSRGSSQPQGSNLGLPHCMHIRHQRSHQGSADKTTPSTGNARSATSRKRTALCHKMCVSMRPLWRDEPCLLRTTALEEGDITQVSQPPASLRESEDWVLFTTSSLLPSAVSST